MKTIKTVLKEEVGELCKEHTHKLHYHIFIFYLVPVRLQVQWLNPDLLLQ